MRRTPTYVPRRAPESAFRAVGDEGGLVVLPSRAEVKVLNEVGSRVYALIDGRRNVAEIARQIEAEFEVAPDRATEDVQDFLSLLEDEGLVAAEPVS
jgi:hypothetical protein